MARLREGRRGDKGTTLVELLISMTIFSLALAMVYSVLITVQRQTKDQTSRADSVGNARLALQQIDRQVRSGNVLYNPASETLP
ncbi:MAG: prepilin-type N-terminal cleavage/methylation domain-containing protein, partial [Frankiaceae bacterium]|nr:prepilin-type N-terminal cleavage/methylation domain-containing protein [Frankiaceae bacterium]